MILPAEIERAKQREEAALLDANENTLRERFDFPAPPDLDVQTKRLLAPFVEMTTIARVRYCPAKPATVAAFALEQAGRGVPAELILEQTSAIAALHDHYGLANAVATFPVRHALDLILKIDAPIDAPRSWSKQEVPIFRRLPADARAAIARRDKDACNEVRRCQNETATLRRELETLKKEKANGTDERRQSISETGQHRSVPAG